MIILDTNVLSEAMRPEPAASVMGWLAAQPRRDLRTTSISVGEILRGLYRLPEGRRRVDLEKRFHAFMWRAFRDDVLNFDAAAADAYARFAVQREQAGKAVTGPDAMIAGIAAAVAADIATRNVADFLGCGMGLINPWEWQGSAP